MQTAKILQNNLMEDSDYYWIILRFDNDYTSCFYLETPESAVGISSRFILKKEKTDLSLLFTLKPIYQS